LCLPASISDAAPNRLSQQSRHAGTGDSLPCCQPRQPLRLGYLDHAVAAEEIDAAVTSELERLKKLDWKSYEQTKARLNELISAAIASAAAEYQPKMAA
jgi:hypothetical protein